MDGGDGTVRLGAVNLKPDRNAFDLGPDVSVSSPVTRQKAAAAKQFIENHYKNYLQGLQDRKDRRRTLQRRAQEAQMSVEEQEEMLRNLERRETEFMRLQRRKVGIDDFEQLTVIGKGAFGEVRLCRAKGTGEIFAMKKLKKSEMLSRGQVNLECYELVTVLCRTYTSPQEMPLRSLPNRAIIVLSACPHEELDN